MLTLDQLQSFAKSFSNRLTDLLKVHPFSERMNFGTLDKAFPKGGCEASSRLILRVLRDHHNFRTTVVHGIRPRDQQEHFWLEFSLDEECNPLGIIDLTCIQFPECPLECPYVSFDRTWHDESWLTVERTPSQGVVFSDDLLYDELVRVDSQ